MPLFVLNCIDKAGALETRLATRPDHLAYVGGSDTVKLGGPYVTADGQPIGSMMIIEAENEAAARAFSDADPYTKAGVFERVDIREWKAVRGQIA
jgi:hypothetical protein